jgi:hypothetical protein
MHKYGVESLFPLRKQTIATVGIVAFAATIISLFIFQMYRVVVLDDFKLLTAVTV